MKPSLRLEGTRDLERALSDLEGLAAKKVAIAAMTESLDPVVRDAKAIVRVRSGALRDSIGVGSKLTRRQKRMNQPIAPAEVYVGPGLANRGGRRAVAHAHLVEFGTVHSRPFPYMTPAWQRNIRRVFDNLAGAMRARLAKIAAKAGR
jgi:hypothetical protein